MRNLTQINNHYLLFYLHAKRALCSAIFLLHVWLTVIVFSTNSSVTNSTEHSVYLYISWTLRVFCKGLLYHNKLFHLCRNTGIFTILKFMLMDSQLSLPHYIPYYCQNTIYIFSLQISPEKLTVYSILMIFC